MAYYYVNKNKQANGDNEVHVLGCSWLPSEHNREYLGNFNTCGPAVAEARSRGYNANGCYHCSNACHTQ